MQNVSFRALESERLIARSRLNFALRPPSSAILTPPGGDSLQGVLRARLLEHIHLRVLRDEDVSRTTHAPEHLKTHA
jgi:hypothetical protein